MRARPSQRITSRLLNGSLNFLLVRTSFFDCLLFCLPNEGKQGNARLLAAFEELREYYKKGMFKAVVLFCSMVYSHFVTLWFLSFLITC